MSYVVVSYHIIENFCGRKLSRIATRPRNLQNVFTPRVFHYTVFRKSVHFELTHTQCYSSGIPTLVVAGASIDVVISISLFGVFLGLVFSDGEW